MTDSTVFVLKLYATDFVTRDIGKLLREKLLQLELATDSDHRIVIDGDGVSIMTPSFVDEFFGRTAALMGIEKFRRRFKISGIEGDTKVLVNSVVRNRLILESMRTKQ